MIVAPSILSCDFSNLQKEVDDVKTAKLLHVDVMDGHFVPNITIGPVVLKNLKKNNGQIFDVHLMISDPLKYYKDFANVKADYITFHYEALNNDEEIIDLINKIKADGIKCGISIKPGTDVQVLDEFLGLIDLVLVMSVEPGFGGQKFMENSLAKIKYLKDKKNELGYQYLIEVDGGINKETSIMVRDAGVEVIVAGTYIFGNKNRKKIIKELEAL